MSLTQTIKAVALELGFAQAGVVSAMAPPGIDRFQQWLAAGFAGEMNYFAQRAAAYEHPEGVLPGCRSLVMLTLPYRTADPLPLPEGAGHVSCYAWGTDYHQVIWRRLDQLIAQIQPLAPGAQFRGVVDTAPLLEREFAQLAGLGWIGKHTLLIDRQGGSYFFLAALLTDCELEPDEPFKTDHCGTCRACLDACPTEAIVAPYQLDPRRCISYLTIELRDAIPQELRGGMGNWVFGCDICQDVCPWNRRVPASNEAAFQPWPDLRPLDLIALFELDDAAFRQRFRETPLWRPRRRGLLRNAAIVLGNQRALLAVPALVRGLADEEPLVRGASAWGLGQIATSAARDALTARLAIEPDLEVKTEIKRALAVIGER